MCKCSKAMSTASRDTVPKDVGNLFFDVNFKDGESKSRGRILALTNQ